MAFASMVASATFLSMKLSMKSEKFNWDYNTEAKINPFFAQVWYPLHDKNENNVYTEAIFKGFEGFKD